MELVAQEIIKQKAARNEGHAYKMPEDMMPKYVANIKWARELASRLENIDAANGDRDKTINRIYDVLDKDYKEMDAYLNPTQTNTDTQKHGQAR